MAAEEVITHRAQHTQLEEEDTGQEDEGGTKPGEECCTILLLDLSGFHFWDSFGGQEHQSRKKPCRYGNRGSLFIPSHSGKSGYTSIAGSHWINWSTSITTEVFHRLKSPLLRI